MFTGHTISYLYMLIFTMNLAEIVIFNTRVRNKYVLSLSLASEHLLFKISM